MFEDYRGTFTIEQEKREKRGERRIVGMAWYTCLLSSSKRSGRAKEGRRETDREREGVRKSELGNKDNRINSFERRQDAGNSRH